MFLIDQNGRRPVCVSCQRLGPHLATETGVDLFVCERCIQRAEAHVRLLAESVPELRDHRLKRWRTGCDCDRCQRRRKTV